MGQESAIPASAGPMADEAPAAQPRRSVFTPQAACASCGQPRPEGGFAQVFVYALGRVEPRFPSLSVEKEFAQAVGRARTADLTDRETARAELSRPENAYLLKQLCWVFAVQGLDTYVVLPRSHDDTKLLVEALRSEPTDLDVLIGTVGPPMGGRACNGLLLPTVALDQFYSFSVPDFVALLPRPKEIEADAFAEAVEKVLQLADNPGSRNDHRALNYLVTRDPSVHGTVAEQAARNAPLTAIHVHPSSFSGVREIMDVIFSFRSVETNVVEQYGARVDVAELFPFLVAGFRPHTEH